MAASSSLALFFILLSAVPSTTLAIHSAATGSGNTLEKACNKTSFPGICLQVLTASPESRTASPRRLAELAFQFLTKEGPVLVAEVRCEIAATKNETLLSCLGVFDDIIHYYMHWLSGLAPELGDAEFAEAKARLAELLEAPSSSGVTCPFDHTVVMVKIVNYEAMMQDTLDLMNAVPRSNPALTDPPANYDAGTAKAPAA